MAPRTKFLTLPREAKDWLEVGEQHLDFLSTPTGGLVFGRRGESASDVSSVLVQIPRDLAGDRVRAALRFEFADFAIQFAGAIEPCPLGRDAAWWGCVGAPKLDQFLACGAHVTAALGIEGEAARDNVPSVRLDLSKTGMSGVIPFCLTSQARLSAEP